MSSLKNCPFCGGRDIKITSLTGGDVVVGCSNCPAEAEITVRPQKGELKAGENRAAETWNTRQLDKDSTEKAGAKEELKRIIFHPKRSEEDFNESVDEMCTVIDNLCPRQPSKELMEKVEAISMDEITRDLEIKTGWSVNEVANRYKEKVLKILKGK